MTDAWYLADALARLRTGCGIRFDGRTYTIYNRFGDLGMCEDPAHALAYYLVQAAFEHQPPARVWPRDMLPFEDSRIMHSRHERTVSDGTETADCKFDSEHRA